MTVLSDLPPAFEHITIGVFYFVGALSLVVNTATLVVIVWKGGKIDSEILVLSAFQQVLKKLKIMPQ